MSFIDNIKDEIKEYNRYKSPTDTNALTLQGGKKRNIFTYIQAKNFGRKYGEDLFKHFHIMYSAENYTFLMDIFGKKKLERALGNPEATTAEIMDMILEENNIKSLDELQYDYRLSIMKDHATFNKATGLNLLEIKKGIKPDSFKRSSLNNKSMIDIFEENGITKDVLKEIYDIYGKEIISQYNMDSSLRNKSILALDGKWTEIFAMDGLQDHVTDYSEEDFNKIFQKYFKNEELSETEKCILIGLLAKESDLIGAYTVKYLREQPDYIKSEIEVGIFEGIVVSRKNYTNQQRKKIATLSKVWNEEDLKRYDNLELLKQRLSSFPQNQKMIDTLQKIDEITAKSLDEITNQSDEIADFMNSVFLNYEVENRKQIIENVYNPEQVDEIIITDLSQMDSSAMLHFFNPDRNISSFDDYVKRLEEKRSKELSKDYKFSEDEKKAMLLQYNAKENHYITDYSIDFEGIGQVGSFDSRYVANTSNQLSAMIATPMDILQGNGIRGQVAVGLSKETLEPELIATISDRNIHSNKGIDYVESTNPFRDFSASYQELTSEQRNSRDNTEVVLFRNSYQSSLKPSYVMYIGNDKLDSEVEKENIKEIKNQIKEAGLEATFVIFDRYSIKEKEKINELKETER